VEDRSNRNLLHLARRDEREDKAIVNAKVQFLCNLCPDLLLLFRNASYYNAAIYTPLSELLSNSKRLNLVAIMIMCEADKTIGTQIILRNDVDDGSKGIFAMHCLLDNRGFRFSSTESVEADWFRYLLGLYPAGVSVKDDTYESPYDHAAAMTNDSELDIYFVRLLLNADFTIEPERRHDLNFAARKEAVFLVYRALTSIIWIKLRCESWDLLMHVISYL
jgi:hypothetical protein